MKDGIYDYEAPSLELVEFPNLLVHLLSCLLLLGKNFDVIGEISF